MMNIWQKILNFLKPQKSTSPVGRTRCQFHTRIIALVNEDDTAEFYLPQYKNSFGKWVALSYPVASIERANSIVEKIHRKYD
jgi:hypothetical protein